MRSVREAKEDNNEALELKKVVARMQERITLKDDTIEKQRQRENEMQEEYEVLESKLQEKDEEINVLQGGIYQLEVLQNQFEAKDVEIENLIMRLAESAEETAIFQHDCKLYDEKLSQKTKYINELKERGREQKSELEDME